MATKELETKVTQTIDEAIAILKNMPDVPHVQRAIKHLREAKQEINPIEEVLESWGWPDMDGRNDDRAHELPGP